MARQIRELREQMLSQQAQIDALKQQNADKDAKLAAAQQSAQDAQTAAASASAKADSLSSNLSANTEAVSNLNSTVTDLKTTNVGLAQTISDTKKTISDELESPLAIHYKGVAITPVAFFAAESVYRQRSLNSDVNTPFNSTPYPGAAQSNTSEFNFSGRQSRIGALFVANPGPFKLSGYVEADFLSAGATSNDNQSNSYTLRQRQIWGQAATNSGFTVTGGQMWSLVTETKKSTDNRTENLPMTIDAQYQVGFSWERQPGVRFQQKLGGLTGAISVEQAEYVYSASNANNNFFIGNAGTGGGLYNLTANYSNNIAPDVIVKFTYDAKVGHFEAGGLGRWFRDRYYPNQTLTVPSAAGAANNTKVGGGFFANARVPVTHFADFGVHFLGGTGVGRYGTSTLPDITVHPDGTLAPIKNYQALGSLELHPAKKLDVFGYFGGEYAQRTVYLSTLGASAGKQIGYAPRNAVDSGCSTEGLPTATTTNPFAGSAPYNPAGAGSCAGATRAIFEGTAGFTYRIYTNPKYGRLQYQMQYSYLTRDAWSGITSATGATTTTYGSPKATNNMVFTSMRYYLP
ncbi:hypothetical protein RBB79_10770 [Tunturiibacter empetritectus]|uniref:Multidrug efflux pump subunit AcrA (Membrane-fusion protein) n=2 Tax=Tunturiibacter TaxID=3154218 RepID=A0A852VEQ6_9BACT|nr:hypothetical protein [Edaphobacter lichenicola]NYF90047.1 multidrug efflux pump subunit AcrA (membrane-fusion protein) [Edaphobacter lichenicola]